jgi:hypothetical protein
MNKIIEVALASKFGVDALTELMEVVTVTPNPEMATEILLGVYEKPEVPEAVVSHQGLEKTLVSVDFWHNRVTYTYMEEVRKHMYVDKNLDTSLITLENYEEYTKKWEEGTTTSFYLNTGEIKQKENTCDIHEWLSQEPRKL